MTRHPAAHIPSGAAGRARPVRSTGGLHLWPALLGVAGLLMALPAAAQTAPESLPTLETLPSPQPAPPDPAEAIPEQAIPEQPIPEQAIPEQAIPDQAPAAQAPPAPETPAQAPTAQAPAAPPETPAQAPATQAPPAHATQTQTLPVLETPAPATASVPQTGIAFAQAARAAQDREDLDSALTLYDHALEVHDLSPENTAVVYNNRGLVYWARGDADRAIADYNAALKLAPQYVDAFQNRALAYGAKGRIQEALADFGAAISLLPENAFALENRGRTEFHARKLEAAIHDLTQALAFDPGDGYAVLWLHIARLRAGQDDAYEFQQNVASVDLTQWPGPILALYLGTKTIDNVRAAVGAAPDRKTQLAWACEANFYAGLLLRQEKTEASAKLFFKEAETYCTPNSVELIAARAELARSGP
jgi:lipoprotein NlpI